MPRLAAALAVTFAAATLVCSPALAQDTQTIITQSNVTLDNPSSNWVAQQAVRGGAAASGSNMSMIQQRGNNNVASTDQSGYGNVALLSQIGTGNTAALTQSGTNGFINSTQTGNGIGITVTQTGNAPALTITQTHPGR